MRHALVSALVAGLTLVAASQASAQVGSNPSYASPSTAKGPSDVGLAVGGRWLQTTEARRMALARRLVSMINAGQCDRARALAENDIDAGSEMVVRVQRYCGKARRPA